MSKSIPRFEDARVLVAGDVMLDRYWYGDTARISPEAPVPIVHVQEVEERPGGAANVAVNIAALGAHPTLVGLVGEDSHADVLELLLEGHGLSSRLHRLSGLSTATKLRVVSRHQQLIRLDFEDSFGGQTHGEMLAAFDAALPETDVVVLSDYGKGSLYAPQDFIARAREQGNRVLVDPKGDDFTPYRGASLLTPNLSELEAVVGTCHDLDELTARGERLRAQLGLEALLVTRSDQGMTLIRPGQPVLHVPAHARDVYDVTGAGDTVIGVLAAVLATGGDLEQAVMFANLAAGIVVGKLGTAVARADEMAEVMGEQVYQARGVMSETELLAAIEAARARGERIVMTNGCFDILHAGHVRYLQEAKRLGDRLVVAVNDDASVNRLKGHGRPVNTLARRMDVLAGLADVDWVVSFSESTPVRLIAAVHPDYLVKGGDNRPDEIVGADIVTAYGGQVRVCSYLDGFSTTGLIASVQRP